MIIKHSFSFEAAHRLPYHQGKCFNLHGHSYRFLLTLDLPLDPRTGMTLDFGDLSATVDKKVLSVWDHKNLNDFMENPTAEHIVVDLWGRLAGEVPGLKEIELWEMPDCSVIYRGEGTSR